MADGIYHSTLFPHSLSAARADAEKDQANQTRNEHAAPLAAFLAMSLTSYRFPRLKRRTIRESEPRPNMSIVLDFGCELTSSRPRDNPRQNPQSTFSNQNLLNPV